MARKTKRHINRVNEIVAAWDSGQPLSALCGYTRVTTEADYENGLRDPLCTECWKVARNLVEAKSIDSIHASLSVPEMRAAAVPMKSFSYTFTFNSSSRSATTWNWPPAA